MDKINLSDKIYVYINHVPLNPATTVLTIISMSLMHEDPLVQPSISPTFL